MSDTLTISDGTTVGTEELFIHAAELGAANARTEGWAMRLQLLAGDDAELAVWVTEPGIASHLETAHQQAQRLVAESESLRASLISAAEEYGLTERRIASLVDIGAQLGAWTIGRSLPFLAVFGLAAALGGALTVARLSTLFGVPPAKMGAMLLGWVRANPSLLNNPAFVRVVRGVVSSSDEFVMGLAGIDLSTAVGIGSPIKAEQNAAGITALATIAGFVSGSGVLRETSQTVSQSGAARGATPPRGVADLAARVPAAEAGTPQVRIERYGTAEEPRWVAYITGTADFAATPGAEPFDLTANVHATADGVAASEQAVRDALAAAGAAPSDELLLVGHSQGGLIAARLAESEDMNVVAFVSMGGPLGSVNTGSVPGLSMEHADDLVPALGGSAEPAPGLITVGRTVLTESDAAAVASAAEPAPPFEAHGLTHYRETASLVDASEAERLQDFEQLVNAFVGGSPGVETRWRSERVLPASG